MRSASERVNGQASDTVLTSRFMAVLNQCGALWKCCRSVAFIITGSDSEAKQHISKKFGNRERVILLLAQ